MAKEAYITPIGTAVYPKLTRPDTKFNPEGRYQTNLQLEPDDYKRVKADIQRLTGFKKSSRAFNDDENQIKVGSKYLPFIYDAKMNKIVDKWAPPDDAFLASYHIGGGSRIKVGLIPFVGPNGLSLQLEAVQVIEKNAGSSGGDFAGFGQEEGYEFSKTSGPEVDFGTDEDEDDGASALDL